MTIRIHARGFPIIFPELSFGISTNSWGVPVLDKAPPSYMTHDFFRKCKGFHLIMGYINQG